MAKGRVERDFLGKVNVPPGVYYGAETQRAIQNFPISGMRMPLTLIHDYAILKRSAAIANMSLGKLDKIKGAAIVKACNEIIMAKHDDQFVVDVFQAGAGTNVNMNLNEVIANRAVEILGGRKGDYKKVHPNDDVNMSQSTNDTFQAAVHVTAYRLINQGLIPSLKMLEAAFDKKAKEFESIVKIGRTHLQDAVPLTLGQEFSGYSSAVARERENIEEASQTLLGLSLGGTAVGTGLEASKAYSEKVIDGISRYTKIRFRVAKNFFDVQQNQIEEEWVSSALRGVAIVLSKIANDLRLMSSGPEGGFEDIILPAVQPGSSIMPGKVNPSMAEMLNMVCFEVIGNDATIAYAAESGQLELNVYMPIIAYNLLYSIQILSNSVSAFARRCVFGIKANEKRLKEVVERDSALVTALAPKIGYAKASKIALKAQKEGKTIRQICLEMKLMPKAELDKLLSPKGMTKRKSR